MAPIANHARSTGRLDVFGHWTEDVDLITELAPRMAHTGTAVEHDAQAFGFDIGPTEDLADVTAAIGASQRVSRHEFGDTKYRRIVYHSLATTRFREYLPPSIAATPSDIQREETWQDAADEWLEPLVRDVPSSARPATPDVVQTSAELPLGAPRRRTDTNPRAPRQGCTGVAAPAVVLLGRRRTARRRARARGSPGAAAGSRRFAVMDQATSRVRDGADATKGGPVPHAHTGDASDRFGFLDGRPGERARRGPHRDRRRHAQEEAVPQAPGARSRRRQSTRCCSRT